MSAFDTVLPQLTWSSATLVNVAAHPGQGASVRATLQDEVQRSFTGTLDFDPSRGAIDGGLDTGAEGASRWYYLYLVPSSGNPSVLAVRGSTTDPRTGPTGYSNWVYVGAVYNDSSSNIYPFCHWGDRFDYTVHRTAVTEVTPTVGSLVSTSLADYVPISASHALFYLDLWVAGVWGGVRLYIDGFTSSDWWFFPTGNWGIGGFNMTFVPTYIPTPTVPKVVWHKLTNDGGSCSFSYMDRQVVGWLDGFLREAAQ